MILGEPVTKMIVRYIFAAGNLFWGADMHDLCALEGKLAAGSIITVLKSNDVDPSHYVTIKAKLPIRYIVPHKIAPTQIRKRVFLKLFPWPVFKWSRA
jgi:hypothetical protein